jgi:hypothetical protein
LYQLGSQDLQTKDRRKQKKGKERKRRRQKFNRGMKLEEDRIG